ncbi:ABC transporter substrate-binding protein [Sandarakinorhabdus sp. AAP62]|uniref:ABC transporter substrate-binding protein n=1 Tax=Sandarakinorhabdus sp. AAP62 TaxID=1248916 RepID=UPI001267057F|nr:ABC transporter substrate-binding protein [Sandarakinorhabdus sp. AAP62]
MTMGVVAVAATPSRIVSLNLCTDEYLLLTARPGQIASISRLGADPQESPLADRARGLATNNGQLGDVLAQSPQLVLTMGHDPQATALAARLGLKLVALPYPASPDEVAAHVRQVAALVGNAPAGAAFASKVAALTATAPPARAGLMIGGSGLAPAMNGLAAAWLRLAGIRQQRGGQISLETLLVQPPAILIRNVYRPGQRSLPQAWTQHPALRQLKARQVEADGRAFLCGGAAMPAEIMRLRKALS